MLMETRNKKAVGGNQTAYKNIHCDSSAKNTL